MIRPAPLSPAASFAVHPTCAWVQAGTEARTLRLFGQLGSRELTRIAESIQERARSPREILWIDFESVDHVDYRAIPDFARALTRVRARGVTVWVTGLSRYLRSLVDVSGQGPVIRSMEWNSPTVSHPAPAGAAALRARSAADPVRTWH